MASESTNNNENNNNNYINNFLDARLTAQNCERFSFA